MEKLACITVTYNRKEELLKNVQAVFSQTVLPELFLIIDNFGKDGAEEYLKENGVDTARLEWIRTEENIGGAGGFELGLSLAFERGFHWFILMDDDGRAWGEDCFSSLFSEVEKKGLSATDKVFLNALVLSDEKTLSFGLGHIERVEELPQTTFLEEAVNPFNGTLISRGLILAIGLPNGKFFIKGDEVDYEDRAKRKGAVVGTATGAKYYHPAPEGRVKKRLFGREFYLYTEAPWKEYYGVRNRVYSLLRSGEKGAKRRARLFLYKRLYSARKLAKDKYAAKRMIKLGYRHAKKGILGGVVTP